MADLTARELDVLTRMANGSTYEAIGREYDRSVRTICWIGQVVMRKLGARSIAHAVLLACQAGILDGRPRRHGDHAGYAAHVYRGEDPTLCEPCRAGESAYRIARRAERRGTAQRPIASTTRTETA